MLSACIFTVLLFDPSGHAAHELPSPAGRRLLMGLAMGITAILIISLSTYLDSSLKTPVIFSKTVNLKLLSMVNFTNLKGKTLSELIIDPPAENKPVASIDGISTV